MIVALGAVLAHAQVEVCADAWTTADWTGGMDGVDQALAGLDGDLAQAIVDDMLAEAYCTGERLPPELIGRFAQQSALLAFYGQDEAELQAWGALARDLLPDAAWTSPAPARFHDLLRDLPPAELATAEGKHLGPPRGGAILLDGRVTLEPAASIGSAHLVQVADKKGRPTWTAFTVGAAFPPEALGAEPVDLEVPRWYAEPELRAEPPELPVPAAPEGDPGEVAFDGAAGTCPWEGQPREVDAGGRRVTIEGVAYPVRTDDERAALRAVLRSCGELRAARRFSRWSAKRGTLMAGAGAEKRAMVNALLTAEPKKKRPYPATTRPSRTE